MSVSAPSYSSLDASDSHTPATASASTTTTTTTTASADDDYTLPSTLSDAHVQLKSAHNTIRQLQQKLSAYNKQQSLGLISPVQDNGDDNLTTSLLDTTSTDADAVSSTAEEDSDSAEKISPEAYYATPWWKFLLKRLPWLIALLLLQSFGALILDRFEKLIQEHLVLNFFIPMMVGTSGNAGNQPGVIVTRASAMGKLNLWKTIRKEFPLSVLIGGVLGCVAYLRIYFVYPDDHLSALAIAISMFLAVIVAVHLSILFSILLSSITCCDPADGAVPLLSTVSDIMGIVILVGIASRLLPHPKDQ